MEVRFEDYCERPEPFMAAIAALGLPPERDEFAQANEFQARFGPLKRAFALVEGVTGPKEWDTITRRCADDQLVNFALGRFRLRPPVSSPPLVR